VRSLRIADVYPITEQQEALDNYVARPIRQVWSTARAMAVMNSRPLPCPLASMAARGGRKGRRQRMYDRPLMNGVVFQKMSHVLYGRRHGEWEHNGPRGTWCFPLDHPTRLPHQETRSGTHRAVDHRCQRSEDQTFLRLTDGSWKVVISAIHSTPCDHFCSRRDKSPIQSTAVNQCGRLPPALLPKYRETMPGVKGKVSR
jgi:hypothetical protein